MDSRDLKSMAGEPEPHVVGPLQPEPLENKIRRRSSSNKKHLSRKNYAVSVPAPGR